MEVHAHTHTPRKKWTHYFWEFLMLFLAVFCGFLAENQREHFVEKHRAKEYAKSLFTDLKADTTELNAGIRQTEFIIRCIDSLLVIPVSEKGKVPGRFYYFSRFTSNAFFIDWSRSTIQQLIQSGNLRYFRNKELVEKISNYYALQELIAGHNQTDREHRNIIMSLRNSILTAKNYTLFSSLKIDQEQVTHLPSSSIDPLMHIQLDVQPGSELEIDKYLNFLNDRKWRLYLLTEGHYLKAGTKAAEIIDLIRKEYQMK
jgi:hypothetical protein